MISKLHLTNSACNPSAHASCQLFYYISLLACAHDQFSWPYFTVWPAKFISLLEFKYSPSILTER